VEESDGGDGWSTEKRMRLWLEGDFAGMDGDRLHCGLCASYSMLTAFLPSFCRRKVRLLRRWTLLGPH
jgi:hypothetical protein